MYMENNTQIPESGSSSSGNGELAEKISTGNYDSQENGSQIFNADNGIKIKVKDQAGADQMANWLKGSASDTPTSTDDYENKYNSGILARAPLSEKGQNFLQNEDGIAENARADARHQEALDSNKNAYSGMTSTGISSGMTKALESQDALAEKAKAEARHQEALDSNKKAYSGMTSTGISSGMTKALELQDALAEKAKAEARHQAEIDKNNKLNEGFTGKHFSQTGQNALRSQDTISEIAKENASLQEQNKMLIERLDRIQAALDKLTGGSTPYQQDPALAAALDPNKVKPLNPLEEVQQKLLKEQEQKQIDFAKQVAEEDRLHNPLNPNYSPAETTPTTPEVTKTTPEQAKKERRLKTAAFIAGAVVGTAGGVMGGTATSLIGVAACTVLGYASRGIDKWAVSSSTKLQEKIDRLENGAEKDKLIKRKTGWEKVKNSLVYVKQFLAGAGIGFSASGLAMGIASGGHGLLWNKPEIITPGGLPTSTGGAEASLGGAETSSAPIPETYSGNSFIHDGHVDLPGSAWDGNMAGGPAQDILPGGAENFSNYAGGQYEMAASRLGEDLASYNVTDNLLSNLATPDKHQLLNQYLRAIQSGNANPDLIEALRGMNSDGATKLLQALGQ
jgi:hypothetical protein